MFTSTDFYRPMR